MSRSRPCVTRLMPLWAAHGMLGQSNHKVTCGLRFLPVAAKNSAALKFAHLLDGGQQVADASHAYPSRRHGRRGTRKQLSMGQRPNLPQRLGTKMATEHGYWCGVAIRLRPNCSAVVCSASQTLDTKTLDTKTVDAKTLDTKTLNTKTLIIKSLDRKLGCFMVWHLIRKLIIAWVICCCLFSGIKEMLLNRKVWETCGPTFLRYCSDTNVCSAKHFQYLARHCSCSRSPASLVLVACTVEDASRSAVIL